MSKIKSDRLYRYYYGETTRYKTAQKLKEKAVNQGYEHAFIVAFEAGKKIDLQTAISQE